MRVEACVRCACVRVCGCVHSSVCVGACVGMRAGVPIDAVDAMGWSALHAAASAGQVTVRPLAYACCWCVHCARDANCKSDCIVCVYVSMRAVVPCIALAAARAAWLREVPAGCGCFHQPRGCARCVLVTVAAHVNCVGYHPRSAVLTVCRAHVGVRDVCPCCPLLLTCLSLPSWAVAYDCLQA